MTEFGTNSFQNKNEKKGLVGSLLVHLLLLLIFFLYFIPIENITEQSHVIQIEFGEPDTEASAAPQSEPIATKQPEIAQNTPSKAAPAVKTADVYSKTKEETAPIKSNNNKADTKPKPVKQPTPEQKKDVTKDNAEAENAKKEAEKAAKAQAEKDALDAKKKQFSDLLNKGKGTTPTSSGGDENGKPNNGSLDGMSKGSGRVGGGLNGRGVLYEPTITDNTQKVGKVSLIICVNTNGIVSSVDFTQKGSTTSDPYLIDLAKKNATKYKFTKSDIESQCGTIMIDFKVQ